MEPINRKAKKKEKNKLKKAEVQFYKEMISKEFDNEMSLPNILDKDQRKELHAHAKSIGLVPTDKNSGNL